MNSQSDSVVGPGSPRIFFSEPRVTERPIHDAAAEQAQAVILACVDDTAASRPVVQHAAAVGRGLGLSITLARVVETAPQFEMPIDPVQWQLRRNEHRDQLNHIAASPSGHASPMESVLLTGPAGDRLSDWAIEHRVPLLALATHGHTVSRHSGLGATAQRILERAATSMLLVPLDAGRPDEEFGYRKVLVPLDGSCRAESVLPLASRIARTHGAEIVLAHVVPRTPMVDSRAEQASDLCNRLAAHNEHRARDYLDELRRKLRGDGLAVSTIVAPSGDARAELRKLTTQLHIDLIVLSSHGQSGLADVPCGSVTEYLATHAPAPMLIVRPNFIHGFSETTAHPMPEGRSRPLAN